MTNHTTSLTLVATLALLSIPLPSSFAGEIDPATWAGRKVAAEGGKFLAADGQSRLYFARGSALFRLTPPRTGTFYPRWPQ